MYDRSALAALDGGDFREARAAQEGAISINEK
jgi:hypothetical protein